MSHEYHASLGKTYLLVFLALCGLTGLSIVADVVHLADKNVLRAIVLAIATAKAMCVLMFFMHLKFERAWKYLLLVPTLILAASLPFALTPDIGMQYYTPDVPQVREFQRQQDADERAAAAHSASDPAATPHK